MNQKVQKKRLALAVAVVVAIVLLVPASGIALEGEAGSSARVSNEGGVRASDIVGAGDAQRVLQELEERAQVPDAVLPTFFNEEIGLVEGARDVRANSNGSIVGYVVDAPADEALALLRAHMALRGWGEVSLGNVDGATFVKEDGACTWVLVTCTQVGQGTSVVFRCVAR